MNYKDLQNIAFLSQEILTESATQDHDALDRWPYTSPYLQESTEVLDEDKRPNRLTRSDKQGIKDSFDLYDIILSHLLDEGYAETQEQAEAIMVNMSEDWRESICEGAYDVYLNRMGVKSKLSDMATDMLKSPEEKEKEEKERKKRNKTHSVGGDLMQKYRDAMNKNN